MTEHADLRAVISKAQIIDELEDGLPSWAKRWGGTAWYPPYVHVVKVRPLGPALISPKSVCSTWAASTRPCPLLPRCNA